jgi:hypothetical protein
MMAAGRAPRRDRGRVLWGSEDLLRWVALSVAGLGMVVAGWYVSSGEGRFGRQVGMLDLAVAGVVVACVGHVVWVLEGRRAVGERRRALLGEPLRTAAAGTDGAARIPGSDTDGFVAGVGTRLFHRTGCPLADGRGWSVGSRDEHVEAGRVACGVCRP